MCVGVWLLFVVFCALFVVCLFFKKCMLVVCDWLVVVFLMWSLMFVEVWVLVCGLRVAWCLLLVDVGCWLCVARLLKFVVCWCSLFVVW